MFREYKLVRQSEPHEMTVINFKIILIAHKHNPVNTNILHFMSNNPQSLSVTFLFHMLLKIATLVYLQPQAFHHTKQSKASENNETI